MADDDSRSAILEDTFFLHGHPSKQNLVRLSSSALSIALPNAGHGDNRAAAHDDHTQIILIDDLYGCSCMKVNRNPNQCHLIFYVYGLKRSKGLLTGAPSKKSHLQRSQKIFVYAKFDDFQSNLARVTQWHQKVTNAIYLRRHLPADIVMAKRHKPVLVFVNPAGGAGKAYRLVMEHAVGVWSEAEFQYHIIITEYAGHARDYVQTIQLADWSGIVLASGDGLIYEVINGLMGRSDWQDALQLPIGHVPCGSGNAFITNIVRYSNQVVMDTLEKFVVQAAVLISRHDVIPFDLIVVDVCDGRRIFGFLCIAWGIIADVDCDSERYRFLGGARFTVEGVKRIIQPRVYNGYIDYVPYDAADDPVTGHRTPPNQPTDRLHRYLSPLNEPLTSDATTNSPWRRIDGPFAHILITSKGSISQDVVASSKSSLSDGYLTLQFIRSDGSTRMNLAKTFTKLGDGTHFDYGFVQWMPVRAFRLVPNNADGNIMVDGEKVPYGPIQGEALPGIARCMGEQPTTDSIHPTV